MQIEHDEKWLARVSDHEATQSLGTSHTATTYAMTRVSMAYHEHMERWRSIDEEPGNGQECVFIPWRIDDNLEPVAGSYAAPEGSFMNSNGVMFALVETHGWKPVNMPESQFTKEG